MRFNHIVIQNILRDKATYISYFLSSVFSILIFFLFSTTAFHPMMAEIDRTSTLGLTMLLASLFIYLFSFIFIIYSMYAFLKKKMKTLGIFMMTGASTKQIRTMVFRENMLIAAAAIITALGIGLIIAPLFLMLAKKVLRADSFGMYLPIASILLTIVLFTALFLVVSTFISRLIKKEQIVQLVKADVVQEKRISSAPLKLVLSIIISVILGISLFMELSWMESLGSIGYLAFFISALSAIYFIVTQGMRRAILALQRRSSYLQKTNLLLVSNLKAKGRSHAHIMFLLTILLLGVFVCTSVLYSSYFNVKARTEAQYPYSFQYVSLPGNASETKKKDLAFIETTFEGTGAYDAYHSAYKVDDEHWIGFMSVSNYNALGSHEPIQLRENEYYVAAGHEGIRPTIESIHDYAFGDLKYAGMEEKNIFSTGLRNVYYVVHDSLYSTIDYPEYEVFAYEVENWTDKVDVVDKLLAQVSTVADQHLVASKIDLYETEKFTKSILFFIGFMLSLIFLSAAMSIVYFHLQTSLEGERIKYAGIRKIGLSLKELAAIVTKELAMLIFVPFVFASGILLAAMGFMSNKISTTMFQVTVLGLGIFSLLFLVSFLIIRREYLKKLMG